MERFYFTFRRYWSVLLIQSARGGVKISRSTVSSSASALCGILDGMHRTSPACTTISLPSIQNLSAPSTNVGQLLVVMAVLRDDASLLQQHARQHDFLSDHELPLQKRIQVFQRNRMPRNVLQAAAGAACLLTARLARVCD